MSCNEFEKFIPQLKKIQLRKVILPKYRKTFTEKTKQSKKNKLFYKIFNFFLEHLRNFYFWFIGG